MKVENLIITNFNKREFKIHTYGLFQTTLNFLNKSRQITSRLVMQEFSTFVTVTNVPSK